jgi:outer membrane autotransporter protein
LGLTVGGGSTAGPGRLTVSNGGVVNTSSLTIGDPCGCADGRVTITDGGVVNSFGFTGIGEGSTLHLGDGGLAGAIVTPAIDNRGRIVANFTDTLTLGAAVFGAGRLSKAGPGTLILTGNNTYTGGTTITGGTLQLGDGGTSGSIVGNVTNDGTFAVNRSDTLAFGGVISGTGSLTKIGSGTLTLSGEAGTGAQQGAFQLTNQFLGIMLDPFVDGRNAGAPASGPALAFAPEREELPDDIALAYSKVLKAPPKPATFEQRWSVWGAGYGGSNRTTGDVAVVGSHDLSARTAGGAAGLDYRLAPGTVVGFALAGGGTNWSLAQGIGGGKSDAFQAGVYGTTRWGSAYLAAALAYTNHWMSTDRFAFAGDHLTASFNAQSFGGRVEGGYRFATYYGGLTPYAAIQSQTFHTPGYTEADLNGGGFALGFNSRNATDTRSELGGRFDRLLLLNPEAALTMRARAAWAHDWVSDPTLTAVFQTLPGASFVVNGATPAKNSALASAGAELRLANGIVLLGKFDGEFASHSSTYAGTGTVRYTW